MTDSEIIKALQQGGRAADNALEALHLKYKHLTWVIRLPYKPRSQQEALAIIEEIWQDTLISLVQMIRQGKKIDGSKSLKPFLKNIYKNKLIDSYRQFASKKRGSGQIDGNLEDAWYQPAPQEYHPEEILRNEALLELMHDALEVLGEPCKSILMLDLQGYRNAEIAESLGFKNKAVVASKKKICHYRLRNILEKWKIDPNNFYYE